MDDVDIAIRAPTGGVWVAAAAAIILTGEFYWEISQDAVASFFGRPFLDEELMPIFFLMATVSVLIVVYLIALYARPGRLHFAMKEGALRRMRYVRLRPKVVAGPFDAWSARLVYFSHKEERRGAFKRLELSGPEGFREVLLLNDVRGVDGLLQSLAAVGDQLHAYTVDIEQTTGRRGADSEDEED